jgi:hypothetical protein
LFWYFSSTAFNCLFSRLTECHCSMSKIQFDSKTTKSLESNNDHLTRKWMDQNEFCIHANSNDVWHHQSVSKYTLKWNNWSSCHYWFVSLSLWQRIKDFFAQTKWKFRFLHQKKLE